MQNVNRGTFIAAAAGAVATLALPGVAVATPEVVAPVVPVLHIFECDQAYWVVAATIAEARSAFKREGVGNFIPEFPDATNADDISQIRQLGDNDWFTMIFDDIPAELEGHADCQHPKNEYNECLGDEYGCGEDPSAVTLTAADWANNSKMVLRRRGEVIYEYGG